MHTTLRSPRHIIRFKPGDLHGNSSKFIDLELDTPTKEQVPYNTVMVQNISSNLLQINYGDMEVFVGAGKTWYDPEAWGTRNITVTNHSLDDNDNIVNIIVSRQVDADAATLAKLTGQDMFDVSNGVC